MAASGERPARRRRYVRQPPFRPVDLSPERTRSLATVARYGMITVRQLAVLTGVSERSVRRSLRPLFDMGWVEAVALPRVALAETGTGRDTALAWGTSPGVYVLTPAGAKLLQELGLVENPTILAGRYGPRNCLFLAHELAIRDVRIWFELAARRGADHELEQWRHGREAEIDLTQDGRSRMVRPDSWLVYRVGDRRLVGLVELDRGTERSSRPWLRKISDYESLISASRRLRDVTGYTKARVITIVPDARRRDHLADFVAKHASAWLAERFWFAERSILNTPDLFAAGWRQPGSQLLRPLLRRELSVGGAGHEER